MRYKTKVLARFPSARLIVEAYHADQTPRYHAVVAGATWEATVLDLYTPDQKYQQGAAAAWRSAYYWCVRNPGAQLPRNPPEVLA